MNAIYLMDGNIKESTDESLLATAEIVRQSCKFDLYILPTADKDVSVEPKTPLISAGNRLKNLIERFRSPGPSVADTLLDAGEWSHFVSLTFPSIDAALPALPSLRIGADAFELRVDLLEDISVLSLHRQIALLRDTCTLPIVFTVRSVGQIGKYPPDPKKIFALLEEGLRAGAEWIDVEACWPSDQISAFTALAKERYASTSRLLGSLHITTPQSREQVDQMYVDCSLGGCADVLKVVTGAANNADCELIHTSGSAVNGGKPYIGLCLGSAGARSRILNRRFTPVTHALMAVAAPGQLTVDQLMDARQSEGLCVPKHYFLFGTPIQQSLSPAMHNGAYAALRLPHSYGLREESAATDYIGLLQEASFGGASVTIPHKETIIPLIDEVRGAAVSIGAVNTIVTEMSVGADGSAVRRLVGYNTDWLGIKRPLLRQLLARGGQWSNDENSSSGNEMRLVGLVIGAGGTAKAASYAVNDLGIYLTIVPLTTKVRSST